MQLTMRSTVSFHPSFSLGSKTRDLYDVAYLHPINWLCEREESGLNAAQKTLGWEVSFFLSKFLIFLVLSQYLLLRFSIVWLFFLLYFFRIVFPINVVFFASAVYLSFMSLFLLFEIGYLYGTLVPRIFSSFLKFSLVPWTSSTLFTKRGVSFQLLELCTFSKTYFCHYTPFQFPFFTSSQVVWFTFEYLTREKLCLLHSICTLCSTLLGAYCRKR